ncbi:MAG TPA: permease-like cell division protein FtsX [Candidatus Saccharibacteria bacterium]|nr:permease-like cell division protein FtsX [Candidatus Saccharibacteria bacterium]HRQ06886.1 permease-like cell division protein FtsX [Candidatus Saccharibacteria bacterium]
MARAKRKLDSKAFAQQKRNRRKMLTFYRMFRYGVNNFSRNAWLTIAATAVMTITLLIIFTTVVAKAVLSDTVGQLRDEVAMSIYLKTDTTDDVGKKLINQVEALPSVRSATFISSEEARDKIAQENKDNQNVLNAIKEATNLTPATLQVTVQDINNTNELQSFVDNNKLVKQYINPDHKPSFAGERRAAIQSIGRAVNFAQQVGIIAGSVFVVISSLIIFNTIRMAIFNRKEEIHMMQLIGADKSFIRGPFLIEALMYGFIAAIIATGLGILALYGAADTLSSYKIAVGPTIDLITTYFPFVLLAMIVAGSVIGVISSLLATYRYLKL